jgi:kumamolisin
LKSFRWVGRRSGGAALAVGLVGSFLFLLAAMPASGSTSSSALSAVPQGVGPLALKSGTPVFPTDPSTSETVGFILKPQNLNGLQASVSAGMPGGYLSVSQFANAYGQSNSNIAALQSYLHQYGITTTSYPDGLDVTATGTAGQFNKALSVSQNQYNYPAQPGRWGHKGRPGFQIHGTTKSPLLPSRLAAFVQAILGLTNYPTFGSNAVHTPALASGAKLQDGSLTPADFAKRYNLNPLYAHHATGQGETIGIVTLASFDPTVAQYFWSNVLGIQTLPNRISVVNLDGGSGPIADATGSGETTLDVQQSGALAPNAKIVVYQAPNTDVGFIDGFVDAASQNVADTVSSSWGESETYIQSAVAQGMETAAYATSFDEVYLELAAQGQSTFIASGDLGAYEATGDLGTTNLSAGNPDSSPWVTSAGGTTLPGNILLTVSGNPVGTVKIPAERTWSWDWLWPSYALFGAPSEADFAFAEPLGGGGGFSQYEQTPAYQQSIPDAHRFSATQYLQPTDFGPVGGLNLPQAWNFNPNPSVTTGFGNGRATPDLSANADPFTGYEEYFTFSDQPATVETGWGGTSFVAPQLAGSTAVIDSLLGHRVGFWNTSIYQFAQQHNSPFTPLDSPSASNDNLYYTGTPGHLYNVGSGLGTPDLTQLASDFAGH